MYLSEAIRHEKKDTHVLIARRMEAALSLDNVSPAEPASPPQIMSSDPPEILSSSPIASPAALAGPALANDPPETIYDDFSMAWSSAQIGDPAPPDETAADASSSMDMWYPADSAQETDADVREETEDGSEALLDAREYSDESDGGSWEDEEVPDETTEDEVLPDSSGQYFPWGSKQKCTTSVLTAFPRSVFSEKELSAMRWAAMGCGATDVPTAKQIAYSRKQIIDVCGASAKRMTGAFGNTFTVLDLATILAHEWANPLVRPHVATLPEDGNGGMDRRSQASKWRKEVDPLLGGPMVRFGGKDYYVEEPALAFVGHESFASPVLPLRFFTREGKPWAEARRLRVHPTQNEFLIDVRLPSNLEIPLASFALPYPEFALAHATLGYPNPEQIHGMVTAGAQWELDALVIEDCNLQSPNPYRAKAQGRQILSVPISCYCDDTSGNVSKKWNKHNSILFTLSGLAPEYIHLLYNIHFLATSNTAPPLEMFEAVVKQIQEIRQAGGVEAYDCKLEEEVLLMPWAMDFDGDNPMSSEFSCHVGLSGKCMCRLCMVEAPKESENRDEEQERVRKLLSTAAPRSKADIRLALNRQLDEVLRGAPSNMSTIATETGVKDKYFQHFADELASACARIKEKRQEDPAYQGTQYLIDEMKRLRSEMPEDIFSPVLRLDEFDPATDTPVEILHVVLLGFVKYFWRDAVSRQSDRGKEILIARINSFDTNGLNVARGRGATLVYYAGSLTGRDFRLVVQMAPSILPGLVPDVVYDAWLSLCRLCPLLYQHEISDVSAYVVRLEAAIDMFLATTALWNTAWFNKPKFHILLHAPAHIRRLGPAPLMSTEGYESFNHVIRCRSVHSPRHAPSHDIAQSFSWMHAVRHLLSGGYFQSGALEHQRRWRQAGGSVLKMIHSDANLVKFMGMTKVLRPSNAGQFKVMPNALPLERHDVQRLCTRQTLSSKELPSPVMHSCSKVILSNGDTVAPGGFVLARTGGASPALISKVVSILCDNRTSTVLGLLLQPFTIGPLALPYRLPSIAKDTVTPGLNWCSFSDCEAAVSVFHNCKRNGCVASRTRAVKRERTSTTLLEWEVRHESSPDDLVLNLAQLRSAASLQPLHPPTENPFTNRGDLLRQAVANRRRIVEEGEKEVLTTSDPAVELSSAPTRKRTRKSKEKAIAGSGNVAGMHERGPSTKRARKGKGTVAPISAAPLAPEGEALASSLVDTLSGNEGPVQHDHDHSPVLSLPEAMRSQASALELQFINYDAGWYSR
ncbi:hypothetical protein EV715DRAFT_208510 [Schizophyllum commune]